MNEVTGIVLAATPVNDFDKRLVILTKERGKITAFARGARKPTSQFLACSAPFTYGRFTVFEGKNAYTLNGVNVTDYFVELRDDLELVSYGLYFCELAGYYTKENLADEDTLNLMYYTMKALTKKIMPLKLMKAVFELRLAAINGEAPIPYECVRCKKHTQLTGISFSGGGAVCKEHDKEYTDTIHLHAGALYAVHYVITSRVNKIYGFKLDEESMTDFIFYMKKYMNKYVDREFKTLEMLNMY